MDPHVLPAIAAAFVGSVLIVGFGFALRNWVRGPIEDAERSGNE